MKAVLEFPHIPEDEAKPTPKERNPHVPHLVQFTFLSFLSFSHLTEFARNGLVG